MDDTVIMVTCIYIYIYTVHMTAHAVHNISALDTSTVDVGQLLSVF